MASAPSPSTSHPPADSPYLHRYNTESIMKSLLTSTWHALDQPPPPTLREILGAYKAKGDGDREMLLGMLNAKSAEDQRVASMASLHRTMLEMYNTPLPASPMSVQEGHNSHMYPCHFPTPPTTSYHHSPPMSNCAYSESMPNAADPMSRSHKRVDSPGPIRSHPRDHERGRESPVMTSRKRRRTSRSPQPSRGHRSRLSIPESRPTPPHDLPPSPYSSSSRSSSTGSPRSRESMAIGSLLSDPDGGPHHSSTGRRTSSERSTTSTSPDPMRR